MPICRMQAEDLLRVNELISETTAHFAKSDSKDVSYRQWLLMVDEIDWHKMMKEKDVFIFTIKRIILGVVVFDHEIGVIDLLFVDYECLNDGIGSHLVRFVEKYATMNGFLSIMAYANDDAVAFYKRLNYANLRMLDVKLFGMVASTQCYLMKKYFVTN